MASDLNCPGCINRCVKRDRYSASFPWVIIKAMAYSNTYLGAVRCIMVVVFIGIFITPRFVAYAEDDIDMASLEALTKTQALLSNPTQRNAVVQKDPNAQLMDTQAASLTGTPSNKEAIYHLSGKVMEDIVKATNGDVGKMTQMMIDAKNDPKAFFDKLSPESKKAIEALSKQIESQPTTQRAPAGGN
jgi:hypothetical protein